MSDARTDGPLLEVAGLSVEFPGPNGPLRAVEDVSLELGRGETLGLVGESGSGKTVTSLAIAGLTGHTGGRIVAGTVRFDGADLASMSDRHRADVLGRDIGLIFQQPTRSLNPTMRVGDQIAEVVRRHEGADRATARRRAVEMLERVDIPNAAQRADDYPFTFSGGMCQRVMIAMALVCRPRLLIADEPTTALDVTVQRTVLELIAELQAEMGVSVLLITHDLGVVAQVCRRVAVMYCGQIVETGDVGDVLSGPRHPYTRGLLDAIPRRGQRGNLRPVPGAVPPLDALPGGCRFHPRCAHAVAGTCDVGTPQLVETVPGRSDRCARRNELGILSGPPSAPPVGPAIITD